MAEVKKGEDGSRRRQQDSTSGQLDAHVRVLGEGYQAFRMAQRPDVTV